MKRQKDRILKKLGLFSLFLLVSLSLLGQDINIAEAPAPLFRDPIFDGAADPSVMWNESSGEWWIFYTQRRANVPSQGVAYCYGTSIGIAVSQDDGKTWFYKDVCQGLDFEQGALTFWAPEVVESDDGYHMFVTLIRGIYHNWGGQRHIVHLTSTDLLNWEFQSQLELSSDRVIDPGIIMLTDGTWRLWYKDEAAGSITKAAESENLYSWTLIDNSSASDRSHEAPNVMFWQGNYWLLTDTGQGLGVYKSPDGNDWISQDMIMDQFGQRSDDGWYGQHPDVIILNNKAYMFYFVHHGRSLFDNPDFERTNNKTAPYEWKRSSLQVAELEIVNGRLICNRDKYFTK